MNLTRIIHRTTLSTVLMLIAAALLCACGGSGSDKTKTTTGSDKSKTTTSTSSGSGQASGSSSGSGSSGTSTNTSSTGGTGAEQACSYQALFFLVHGANLGAMHRIVQYRSADCGSNEAMLTAALRELLAGPNVADRALGLRTTIPVGTTLLGLSLDGPVATVDMTRRFESGIGKLSMNLRIAQIVATLTAFSGVNSVAFRLDGKPVTSIGGEGIVVDPPRTIADIEGDLPVIEVDDPAPGDCMADAYAGSAGSLHVSGSANVTEAALFVELRSGTSVLATRPAEAASGTGTRGRFEVNVPTSSASGSGPLTVAVYSRSARDKSIQNLVRIPIKADC